MQFANGVIDVLVPDEAAAVAAAKQYLGYFQGIDPDWDCPDQLLLRGAVPEDRLRVYDVRAVVHGLADTGSVLELRAGWAPGIITALARLEGRPVGIIANNPGHLGGAIDADGADKAARFLQLCDAHDLPVAVALRHARASWSARRQSAPPRFATSPGCSSSEPASPFPT